MEKVGLKIVDLLHDITQLGYRIYFTDDFDGMVTLGIQDEYFENGIYKHYHLGFPGGPRERLEKDIIESLTHVLKELKEKENAEK